MTPHLHPRGITEVLLTALSEAPVVALTGPRQTGKSTLVRDMLAQAHPARYITLDDFTILEAATVDPKGFIEGIESEPVIIDEAQLAPGLFRAIKAAVDVDRGSGRFLLTGSADPMLMPRSSETLAGRARTVSLWPLSQGELTDLPENSLATLFLEGPLTLRGERESRSKLIARIEVGGYPEVTALADAAVRSRWLEDYLVRIVERDVPRISDIADRLAIPRLLRTLAGRSMRLVNLSEIGRLTEIKRATLDRYLALLVATHVLTLLPAWSSDMARRASKRPKPLLTDSGLLCHLLRVDAGRLLEEPDALGHVLESFVAAELLKQASWSPGLIQLSHYRTDVAEVDIVLEDARGAVVGVEVKASSTISSSDFAGLHALRDAAGVRFRRGVVLYTGSDTVPFGEGLTALPVSALWSAQASAPTARTQSHRKGVDE